MSEEKFEELILSIMHMNSDEIEKFEKDVLSVSMLDNKEKGLIIDAVVSRKCIVERDNALIDLPEMSFGEL